MELIRGHYNLREEHRGCAVTIGNFDGIHIGHQAIFSQLENKAAALGCARMVISFEPLPHEYFAADNCPSRLSNLRGKYNALQDLHIDYLLCLTFVQSLAAQTADNFINDILVNKLAIRPLVVGDDFRFGKNRTGDFTLLKSAGGKSGFSVEQSTTFEVDAERVSSTRIRLALKLGDMKCVKRLLGRDYSICGRVCHGDKLGKGLGFATANIRMHHAAADTHGVYAVDVLGIDNRTLPGVASIGTRPSVGGTRQQLEVHIIDFDKNIYGQHIEVRLLHKIRNEEHFDSMESLIEQMRLDLNQAKNFFEKK